MAHKYTAANPGHNGIPVPMTWVKLRTNGIRPAHTATNWPEMRQHFITGWQSTGPPSTHHRPALDTTCRLCLTQRVPVLGMHHWTTSAVQDNEQDWLDDHTKPFTFRGDENEPTPVGILKQERKDWRKGKRDHHQNALLPCGHIYGCSCTAGHYKRAMPPQDAGRSTQETSVYAARRLACPDQTCRRMPKFPVCGHSILPSTVPKWPEERNWKINRAQGSDVPPLSGTHMPPRCLKCTATRMNKGVRQHWSTLDGNGDNLSVYKDNPFPGR